MSQRLDYNQIAPAGVKALGGVYGYVMQSNLPAVLVYLVYLRVLRSTTALIASTCTRATFSGRVRRSKNWRWYRRGLKPAISSTSASAPLLHGPKR
jgi:hypothetical protein